MDDKILPDIDKPRWADDMLEQIKRETRNVIQERVNTFAVRKVEPRDCSCGCVCCLVMG